MGRRMKFLRLFVVLRRLVRGALLLLLCAAVWGMTIYVCGRQAQLIAPEIGQIIMRQLIPGIW